VSSEWGKYVIILTVAAVHEILFLTRMWGCKIGESSGDGVAFGVSVFSIMVEFF
jgi:hypothetical protein